MTEAALDPTQLWDDAPISTVRSRAVRLLVTSGRDEGRSALVHRPGFVVGAGAGADLRLTDDAVADAHLNVSPARDGVRVTDLETTTGTWIGTMRINDVVLGRSTSLTLGGTTLALTIEGASGEGASGEGASGEGASAGALEASLGDARLDDARFGDAIGESKVMRELFTILRRAARSDVGVLLEGESGVGKDVLARGVHTESRRAAGPFVALDCGALPAKLIESELFGHERGAFTGADRPRQGAFVQADGGTLFLDEIGELPLELQPKLLRALESREVRPLGSDRPRRVSVRIVAATNRRLRDAVDTGSFRADLYYRLAVLCVEVPPLRDRREDILPLARAFLEASGGAPMSPELEARLLSYSWPGNVRELRNVVRRYTLLGGDAAGVFAGFRAERPTVDFEDLALLPYEEARAIALDRFERAYVPGVLARSGNVVVRAAELAGVRRGSFHRMLRRIRSRDPDPDRGRGP